MSVFMLPGRHRTVQQILLLCMKYFMNWVAQLKFGLDSMLIFYYSALLNDGCDEVL